MLGKGIFLFLLSREEIQSNLLDEITECYGYLFSLKRIPKAMIPVDDGNITEKTFRTSELRQIRLDALKARGNVRHIFGQRQCKIGAKLVVVIQGPSLRNKLYDADGVQLLNGASFVIYGGDSKMAILANQPRSRAWKGNLGKINPKFNHCRAPLKKKEDLCQERSRILRGVPHFMGPIVPPDDDEGRPRHRHRGYFNGYDEKTSSRSQRWESVEKLVKQAVNNVRAEIKRQRKRRSREKEVDKQELKT
ncbi:hypothetical protein SDJN03_25928, partial [Cucurbita argyrosperma subsp. sororia]